MFGVGFKISDDELWDFRRVSDLITQSSIIEQGYFEMSGLKVIEAALLYAFKAEVFRSF